MSELNPKAKLAGWDSFLKGFQEIEAEKHEAFPNLVTGSVTF